MLPRYLLLVLLLGSTGLAQDDHAKSIEAWRAARVTRLTAPGWHCQCKYTLTF